MSTKIEWTDETWSPVTGCTRISDGCLNCYIERTPPMRMAHRRFNLPIIGGTTGVQLHPDRMGQPLRWRKPRKVFVCSMADLFHEDVTDEFIAKVFAVMAATRQHTFQILTKRHARMRSLLDSESFAHRALDLSDEFFPVPIGALPHGDTWPLPNVWLGVSVEDQRWAGIRIPALLDTPAAVRFLSCEPLLGPLDVTEWLHESVCPIKTEDVCICDPAECEVRVDWVICGGESGPGARPMDLAWPQSIAKQCAAAGVPVHVKQLGSVWARANGADLKGGDWSLWPEPLRIRGFPDAA
jgi:protein gp37